MIKKTIFASLVLASIFSAGCKEKNHVTERSADTAKFTSNYNIYIKRWLDEQKTEVVANVKKASEDLVKAKTHAEKKLLQTELDNAQMALTKIDYRLGKGEYFSFKTPADLPKDLVWENGLDNPEIGDPKAKKGGTMHNFVPTFPVTLRPIGPNANHSSRAYMYDEIDMSLVGMHPITKKFFPGLANEWAISKDNQTVYYKIDPEAKFSDGHPVLAEDFVCYLYIRLSDNIFAPFQKQYFKEEFANITVFDTRTISISLPVAKLELPFFTSITAAPLHFYSEYGPDYKDRYQWKFPPTTGAYTLTDKDIKKGRSFTMSRVKTWWAKDKKFYKYTNNVDRISYQVIGDISKAFELFKLGKIDWFPLGTPDYWYDRMEIDEYFKGYIAKAQFYNVYPRIPRGMFINVATPPLDDLNVRIGLSHAMDFKTVNAVLYRGDSSRLNHFSEGYGEFSNPNIAAREYSVKKAEEHFAKAGYKRRDSEGYFVNTNGERLKIEFSYGEHPSTKNMMAKLKEGAKKAGVEMTLDGQQRNQNFKKIIEKRHQVAYSGWGVEPPFPRYYQFFHSSNAYDKQGNLKKQTNNINSFSNDRMDVLTREVRDARRRDDLKKAAWEVQQIVHDEAIFIPALKTPYVRVGYWSWVKWPNTKHYEFSTPEIYTPVESYLYWIDLEEKKRVLEARANNQELPEKNYILDLYKNGIPSEKELNARKLNDF